MSSSNNCSGNVRVEYCGSNNYKTIAVPCMRLFISLLLSSKREFFNLKNPCKSCHRALREASETRFSLCGLFSGGRRRKSVGVNGCLVAVHLNISRAKNYCCSCYDHEHWSNLFFSRTRRLSRRELNCESNVERPTYTMALCRALGQRVPSHA